MNVSVVIPVLNEEKVLERCLNSIKKQLESEDELIIVDNGSTDKSIEITKKYTDKIIFLPGATLGKLRDTGAKSAIRDIIITTDADAFASDDWIKRIKKWFENPNVAIIFGAVRDELLNETLIPSENNYTFKAIYCPLIEVNCAFRNDLFKKSSGYPDIPGCLGEGIALINNIRFGFPERIIFDPELIVYHNFRGITSRKDKYIILGKLELD